MNVLLRAADYLNILYKYKTIVQEDEHVESTLESSKKDIIKSINNSRDIDPDTHNTIEGIMYICAELEGVDKGSDTDINTIKTKLDLINVIDTTAKDKCYTLLSLNNDTEETKIQAIRSSVRGIAIDNATNEVANNLYESYLKVRNGNVDDIGEFIDHISNKLGNQRRMLSGDDGSTVDEIMLGEASREQLNTILETLKEELSSKSVLKTGWEKINFMLSGGLRYGQFVLGGGSQHNAKTLLNLTLFRHLVTLNEPPDCGKLKPLALRITTEDRLQDNIAFLYKEMKLSFDKEETSIAEVTTQVATDYVLEKLNSKGWDVSMIRVDPSDWAYSNVIERVESFRRKGYEVKIFFMDYLPMITHAGLANSGVLGSVARDLLRRIRNYMSARDILFVTPIQFSVSLDALRSTVPPEEIVKRGILENQFDGGKAQAQEPDVIIGAGLVKKDPDTYLQVVRGKLRGSYDIIPENRKTVYLKFHKQSPIPEWEQGTYSLPLPAQPTNQEPVDDSDFY